VQLRFLAHFNIQPFRISIELGNGLLRLDYISCLLTVVSTILVGRRLWQGWIVAGANSVIICLIGLKTAQIGFIPANVFCLGMYGYNMVNWRAHRRENSSHAHR
jgi:hypothetical protein